MKLFIAITLILNTLLFAQIDKLERLKQLQIEGKLNYTYLGDDIYKLTYLNGETKDLYLGKPKTPATLDSIPTTTIDTWNVDTMLYHNMYSYWKEFPTITHSGYQLIVGDVNRNNLKEIYSHTRDYNDPEWMNMQIFEIDTNGTYTSKHTYADTIAVLWGLYDIKRDGKLELLTIMRRYTNEYIFFKKDSTNGYPTKLDFVFDDYPSQKDDPTFGDFDKNGKTDMVFAFLDPNHPVVICEYDSSINNFSTKFIYTDTIGSYHRGFAVNDFDEDGKTDIVFGGLYGEVNVIENDIENKYKISYSSNTGGVNSFMTFATNDINGNGKPEFWVSSTTYIGSRDVLRFSCYEAIDDNNYKEINRIDFLDIFPIYAHNSFVIDLDKDGKDEIVICFDEFVFVIKAEQNSSKPLFKILYMFRNNIPGGIDGASMYDLNKDGYAELLIHRGKYNTNGDYKNCTDVYKPDFLTSINEENHFTNLYYTLEQNYPNPFNPITSIQYAIGSRRFVTLKVYDVLGKEVATLINENKPEGYYEVEFDASQLPSGMYIYSIQVGDFKESKKMLLLK